VRFLPLSGSKCAAGFRLGKKKGESIGGGSITPTDAIAVILFELLAR